MTKINLILPLTILLLVTAGCFWGETRTEIQKSGRLEYIEYLRFGPAGTHGSNGWYVHEREINVRGYSWHSEKIDLKNVTCMASPNEKVEALKCTSYEDGKVVIYILRMKGAQPELATASEYGFSKPDDRGEWADDGRWLIFRKYFYNVETSEQKEIKNLPDDPDKYFVAAAPDLKTIIFRDFCYSSVRDEANQVINREETEKQCEEFQKRQKNGIAGFWLIEPETGNRKLLELKIADYPFAENKNEYIRNDWRTAFNGNLIWKKDQTGKDQLSYPK